jgi:integrase
LLTARGFLSFLFENGVTKANLSVCVPRPARPRALPSIYSGDEVKRLLSSADRASASGKRDYAVLLLASHLGMRSSDIAGLSFKDIDCTAKTIKIIQAKTARPLTLVMNGEAEEAIADYIRNGRPHSPSDRIFLGSRAPYSPITAACGYAIARRHFDRAGIAAQGRRRGAHALRASYATALVAKGVPYTVVKEALGHEDRESAKYYVRIDVRRLRMCALDVPKPAGAFAVMLEPDIRRTLGSGNPEGALQ